MPRPLPLLPPVRRRIEALASKLLQPPGAPPVDFCQPPGEPALIAPDSVAWRIFKNPVSLFIGGVAAVLLELAEPAVRTGVWEHSSFRSDPMKRLQRTGLAAMVTIYGPRSSAEAMIAGIVRRHDRVVGQIPSGEHYYANDPRLLTWVHATASFGFVEAYHRYVVPLSLEELDRFYREGIPVAHLYGAVNAPDSVTAIEALFASMRGRLEPSPIVHEFLGIMGAAVILPAVVRPIQRLLVRAAVDLIPVWTQERLGLRASNGLRAWETSLVAQLGRLADRVILQSSAAVQASKRLGLPGDYLYRREPRSRQQSLLS